MSNVMFLATANNLSEVSEPLKSRMEIIYLEDYNLEQKVEIAKNYIVPSINKKIGSKLFFSDDILKYVNDESKAEILHDREFGIVKTLKESEENFIKTGEKTVIAITGKGWETTMKVEGKNVPIKSDMKIVTENLY